MINAHIIQSAVSGVFRCQKLRLEQSWSGNIQARTHSAAVTYGTGMVHLAQCSVIYHFLCYPALRKEQRFQMDRQFLSTGFRKIIKKLGIRIGTGHWLFTVAMLSSL